MNNSEWFDYNSEVNNFHLHTFFREYDYTNPETFEINYNNEGFYNCKLRTSMCFKGLVYIVGTNIDTNEKRNFAVGDDNIISWKPPYSEPDLMVG